MKCAARSLEVWISIGYLHIDIEFPLVGCCLCVILKIFSDLKLHKITLTAGLLGNLEISNIRWGYIWRLKPNHNHLKNTRLFFSIKQKQVFLTPTAAVTISLDASQQNIDERVRGDRSLLEVTACHYCHYYNTSITSIQRLKLLPLKNRGRNTKREKCN